MPDLRRIDCRRLLNECPTVVGMMTSSLESGSSLDSAVRMIAAEGPKLSRMLFSGVARRIDTKACRDMASCVTAAISRLPEDAAGYRRAIHLCIAASESSGAEERTRMLKDASDISLLAVKDMGEAYGASLNTPFMTIFGLGILVPMILMSILPMLSIGGMLGPGAIDQGVIVVLTLAVIPAAILTIAVWMRETNPFLRSGRGNYDMRCAAPMLIAVPSAIVCVLLGCDEGWIIFLSMAPACAATILMNMADMRRERLLNKCEQGLRDSVFDIGSRMMSGNNFERAVPEAILARKECKDAGRSMARELLLCRGDVAKAVHRAIRPISEDMAIALTDVYRCSRRDMADAGKLAMALGRQFQNQNHARKSLEISLKSMTDMMTATSMFFAPIILGMSVSMLEPLSGLSGFQSLDGTSLILSIYLTELCLTITVLLSGLGSGESFRAALWRFCILCPLAQAVFCVCCGIAFRQGLGCGRWRSWRTASGLSALRWRPPGWRTRRVSRPWWPRSRGACPPPPEIPLP